MTNGNTDPNPYSYCIRTDNKANLPKFNEEEECELINKIKNKKIPKLKAFGSNTIPNC